MPGLTVVHVTHEAVEHMGGIGTVLQGLMTSTAYRRAVRRSILVGPLPHASQPVQRPLERLGSAGTACLYSGPDGYDPEGYGAVLQPIEWAFGSSIVLGRRKFHEPGATHDESRSAEADILLIDVSNPDRKRLAEVKFLLWDKFRVDSARFEHSWDYEEYCRLAGPAYHALSALADREGEAGPPAVVIAHEFMGLATALRCSLNRGRFRTVFHAHECSTARRVCEALPGHDTAFYPALRAARAKGQYLEEVFGPQGDFARHALVSMAHRLDLSLAVGPETKEELHFLSKEMASEPVRLAYNGLPAPKVTAAEKERSRELVMQWLQNVTGTRPDYLITHVTRPVISKGLWRDQRVLAHLEPLLKQERTSAAYVLLTCGAPIRTQEQARQMAASYGWPLHHRPGYPDLEGPEGEIWSAMLRLGPGGGEGGAASADGLNGNRERGAGAPVVWNILVNQFGFSRERLGDAAPANMSVDDLRRAADAELGLSVYEPFGIAMLEPLHAGAVCAVSSVCGCCGLVQRALKELAIREGDCPLVLVGDFTGGAGRAGSGSVSPHALAQLTSAARERVEEAECRRLASELFRRLPRGAEGRRGALELGQRIAPRLSWDAVVESDFLPGLESIVR